ncbi:MAG TPA: nucleoside-diphosphate kinase [Candidatus Gracilibacteria bacterium]
MERTLILIKPDAIERGLMGEVLSRFEKKGLKIVGLKMMQLQEAILREHYAHVVGRPFYAELSDFMSSSPVVAVALEGLNAVEIVRKVSGTDNMEFGTIRGDFCVSCQKNLVHSSDSLENATREIDRFFEESELFDYDKNEWRNIYAQCDKDS